MNVFSSVPLLLIIVSPVISLLVAAGLWSWLLPQTEIPSATRLK